jgi:LPS sulfotransferase NodH
MPVDTLYILAALPRTGSSLMVDIFQNAGIPTREIYANEKDDSPVWVADQIARGDVAGVKPIFQHFINKGMRPDIWFDKFRERANAKREIWVFMDRYDKIRQAMSYDRAHVLNEWVAFGEPAPYRSSLRTQVVEDRLAWMQREQLWWSAYFGTRGILPLRLYYEDWTKTPESIQANAQLLLGVTNRMFVTNGRMRRKQSGEDIEQHIQRLYQSQLEWLG